MIGILRTILPQIPSAITLSSDICTNEAPKKSFIVEFKQARRVRSKSQPSIWAAVDFKSVGNELDLRALTIGLQHSSKQGASSASPETPKAQRILPALGPTRALAQMEVPSIGRPPPEQKNDIEAIDEVPVELNVLSTEPGAIKGEAAKTRSRRKNGETLPAGQRWKRRLPRILRQSAS